MRRLRRGERQRLIFEGRRNTAWGMAGEDNSRTYYDPNSLICRNEGRHCAPLSAARMGDLMINGGNGNARSRSVEDMGIGKCMRELPSSNVRGDAHMSYRLWRQLVQTNNKQFYTLIRNHEASSKAGSFRASRSSSNMSLTSAGTRRAAMMRARAGVRPTRRSAW